MKSRDVIDHVTNRFSIGHFLLVFYRNRVSVSDRFRDIWPQIPVRTHRQKDSDTHRLDTRHVILYSVPFNALHWTDNNTQIGVKLWSCNLVHSPTASLPEWTRSDNLAPASSHSIKSEPSFSVASSHRTPVATRWMLSLLEYSNCQQTGLTSSHDTNQHTLICDRYFK